MNLAVGYFDESSDGESGHVYVIAGFLASQQATVVLDLRWKDLLDDYEIEYFKTSELSTLEGQFKKFRDNPELKEWTPFSRREKDKQREIITAFIDCIVGCGGLFGIGAAIILPDYHRLLNEYPPARTVLRDPYYICTGSVLAEAGMQMLEANRTLQPKDQAFMKPIFDSHEDYSGRAKMGFDAFCISNREAATYLLPLNYESDKDYRTLQAADLFAFETRKKIFNLQDRPELPERVPLTRLKNSGSVARIQKLDYPALKDFVDIQNEDFATSYQIRKDKLWHLKDILLERSSSEE